MRRKQSQIVESDSSDFSPPIKKKYENKKENQDPEKSKQIVSQALPKKADDNGFRTKGQTSRNLKKFKRENKKIGVVSDTTSNL